MLKEKLHTKHEIICAISAHKDQIKALGVKKLGLFGSFQREVVNESSDVDLLVEFLPGKKTFDNFMDLSFFLEDLFGRKVELVTPQSLSKFIGPHIIREVEDVKL